MKTALITGATGGIGGKTAEVLGQAGYEVIVTGIDEAGRDTVMSNLESKGIKAHFYKCDATSEEQVKDLINLTQNLDLYRFYPDISDDEGLGRLYADELGTIDIPEHIQNYFDYEAYGRDVRINEGGVFAPGGYVSAVPEGFKEYYHGPQDIPPEHRIFAYPEKAEPVHSILATLKRFQEAPPAPKKDKAGPSHEER